jgi:arylsulfatase A-like enzyme
MRRLTVIAIAAVALGSASACRKPVQRPPAAPERCPDKPNILLVVLDTTRFDATQLDPASQNPTPFLLKLKRVGANFVSCYSTFDSTPPSHFSMLTGFVDGYQTAIDRPEVALAYQLKSKGYDTFGIAANANLSAQAMRTVMPFSTYEDVQDEWLKKSAAEKAPFIAQLDGLTTHYDGVTNDWTRMFLYGSSAEVERRFEKRLKTVRAPFFGFLNTVDSHDPYFPDPAHYSRAGEKTSPPSLRFRKLPSFLAAPTKIPDPKRRQFVIDKINQAGARAWSTTLDLTDAQLAVYRQRYRAEVGDADRTVKRIFELLQARSLLRNTIVIITSDHGESLGEDQLITHTFYDKGDREVTHHVPLLIVFPPCYRLPATNISTICTIADIAPTIYEILGIDPKPLAALTRPGNFGRSLMPLLSVPRPRASATAATDAWRVITEEARKKQDEEAVKRLKALGYIGD